MLIVLKSVRLWQMCMLNLCITFIYLFIFVGLNPQVEQYLEEHMMKTLSSRTTLLTRPLSRNKMIRRRMSVKGAIKKTRSIINAESRCKVKYQVGYKVYSLSVV